MNASSNTGENQLRDFGHDAVSSGHRRAELLLIAELIVVFTLLLQPHSEDLSRFCDKLPLVTSAVGHGICSALVS